MAAFPFRNPTSPMLRAAVTSSTHLLAAAEGAPSYSPEDWGQFFTRHFQSASFNAPDEGETIDTPEFRTHVENYVKQLKENVKGSPHIRVPFHDLPECRADTLSPHMHVKVGVRPRHVSLFLAKLTLDTLCAALQERAGMERTVHIDFGRRSVEEESPSHAGGSTPGRSGFFTLPFKEILMAMPHFGARSDQGGAINIKGLHATADLSGLKIEDPDELSQLHNLVLRSTIAALHIDLSLIQPNYQNEAWRKLENLLLAPGANTLHELTLNVPTQTGEASLYAAEKLADALCAPGCHLQSLTLIGGDWTDEAKALLTDAANKRQNDGKPITITVGSQQLGLPMQG